MSFIFLKLLAVSKITVTVIVVKISLFVYLLVRVPRLRKYVLNHWGYHITTFMSSLAT